MKSLLAFAAVGAALAPLPHAGGAEPAGAVKITRTKEAIEFRLGDALVSRYHVGPNVAKPYFWPLHAAGDVPVTRAWPMKSGEPLETRDHVHQKSAWFCHGDVIPEGVELKQKVKGVEGVDFWSETPGHGTIICVKVGDPEPAGTGQRIATWNEWRTADGVKVLDEERVIAFRPVGSARLFTLTIDLHASVCPITFGDTKEGAMGVRVNDQVTTKNGGHFVNAAGKWDEKEVWGRRSPWCDYSGKIDGKEAGIAVFDDPSNPPACWHARGYGLMAANPFGRARSGFPDVKDETDLVRIEKGRHLKLRYGILLHTGDAESGKVAKAYEAFKKAE